MTRLVCVQVIPVGQNLSLQPLALYDIKESGYPNMVISGLYPSWEQSSPTHMLFKPSVCEVQPMRRKLV